MQLPIFIALYNVVSIMTSHSDKVARYTYDFIAQLGPIHDIIVSSTHTFNESLLGIVNLSKTAVSNGTIYWPLMVVAVLSAVLQYYQSKQITPQPTEHKRLRDVMSATAQGQQVDQAEVSAIMSQRMLVFFPLLTFMVMIYLPGAISLYTLVSSIVAVIQQHYILNKDVDEMEALAGTGKKSQAASEAKQRADVAVEAELVSAPRPRGKKRSKRR